MAASSLELGLQMCFCKSPFFVRHPHGTIRLKTNERQHVATPMSQPISVYCRFLHKQHGHHCRTILLADQVRSKNTDIEKQPDQPGEPWHTTRHSLRTRWRCLRGRGAPEEEQLQTQTSHGTTQGVHLTQGGGVSGGRGPSQEAHLQTQGSHGTRQCEVH